MRHRGEKSQPAARLGHSGVPYWWRPKLVDENQVVGIERRLVENEDPPRLGYIGAILLGGVQALFLSVIFGALRNRHKLISPTVTLEAAANAPRMFCNSGPTAGPTSSNTVARCSTRRER
jgi:hypothetical protein